MIIYHRQSMSAASRKSSAAKDRDLVDKISLHAYKGCRPSASYYYLFFSNYYYHIIVFCSHVMRVSAVSLKPKLQSHPNKNINDFIILFDNIPIIWSISNY